MTVESHEEMRLRAVTGRLELMDPERVLAKLRTGEEVKGSWLTAPTGKPHIGYLVPLIKIAECIAAGIPVRILVVDSYAYLINHDVSMEVVEYRTQYYTFLLAAVLRALSVAAPDIDIRHESAYSMSAEFTKDKMKMCAVSSVDEIRDVGSEVHDTRILSPLLCPIYPALSDVYLGTDFQLGGFDQRGIFEYSRNSLPRIGREPPSYLMAAMIPGLKPGKMSSSGAEDTKIMFTESEDAVNAKIAGADMPAGDDPSKSGVMAILEHIVFPFRKLGSARASVEIPLADGDGLKEYWDYEEVEKDFVRGLISPDDLRTVLARELNRILGPVREEYAASSEWRLVEKRAYGTPNGTSVGK